MALPKIIVIKETEIEIKHRLKTSPPFIAQRLRVLLILKQHELDIPAILVLRHIWGLIIRFEIESPSFATVQNLPCHTFGA